MEYSIHKHQGNALRFLINQSTADGTPDQVVRQVVAETDSNPVMRLLRTGRLGSHTSGSLREWSYMCRSRYQCITVSAA